MEKVREEGGDAAAGIKWNTFIEFKTAEQRKSPLPPISPAGGGAKVSSNEQQRTPATPPVAVSSSRPLPPIAQSEPVAAGHDVIEQREIGGDEPPIVYQQEICQEPIVEQQIVTDLSEKIKNVPVVFVVG